jgi:hypothetical protein
MPRNLYERCEVAFPIFDPAQIERLKDEVLAAYLADNSKARLLMPDGEYVRPARDAGPAFSAQEFLMRLAEGRETAAAIPPPALYPIDAELPRETHSMDTAHHDHAHTRKNAHKATASAKEKRPRQSGTAL